MRASARILSVRGVTAALLAVALVTGRIAADVASEESLGMLTTFAAGAVLAALADTVMPEAYTEGGPLVAFATSGGFLLAYARTTLADGGVAAAANWPGAARGSGRRAARQRHGSRPRDAPSDPYAQGDEMSTALIEAQTASERDALALLPIYVAERTTAMRVSEVEIR